MNGEAIHPAILSGRAACYLDACLEAPEGQRIITSESLGAAAGVIDTQVRRDLMQLFGRAGTRGVGYNAIDLAVKLRQLLAPYALLHGIMAANAENVAQRIRRSHNVLINDRQAKAA